MADLPSVLPASFRGVPFAVRSDAIQAGRRFAAFVYPGQDGQRLGDLGRRARRYPVRGFIVSDSAAYGGGPVALQRQLILAAADQPGTGILVHPTLGILTVGCETCSVSDDLDAGTRADVEFSFLEDTQNIFGISTSTIAAVVGAALLVDGAASTAFEAANISGVSSSLASAQWSGQVAAAAQDATALTNLASQLPGPYGRYFAGANTGPLSAGSGSPYSADATVGDLVADAVTARAGVGAAAVTVSSSVSALTPVSAVQVATYVQALVAALLACCADPGDAIRILSALAASTPTRVTGMDGLYRRAVVAAAARASTTYQPSSSTDAANVQGQITGLLDDEITTAGDAGDDASYQAFKALRAAVVADLQARGAALAPLATFTFPASLPALYLAQRLYADATRADELVAQADPVNPLFMPPSFQALAG